jgi:hypothetical protein
MSSRRNGWAILVVALPLVIGVALMFRGGCVSPDTAVAALKNQGFTDIVITDHAGAFVGFLGCGNDDAARFTAQATNPAGKRVKIFVCVGWPFKGATLRSMD